MDRNHQLNDPSPTSHHYTFHDPAFLYLRGTFLFPGQSLSSIERSPSNLHVIPANQEHLLVHTSAAVTLHHLPTQTYLWRILCPSFNFAYHSQQQLLALAPGDPAPSIVLWDLHIGQILRTLTYETKDTVYHVNPGGLAFHPDRRLLAAGMEGRKRGGRPIVLWDVNTGQVLQALETAERADITTLAFHPGGDLLAGGSFNHPDVWIWDITAGNLLQTWKYPEDLDVVDRRYEVAFDQEGARLFSACGMAGLRVWDVTNACEVAGPSEEIEAIQVVVAPDGHTLAVAHNDEGWSSPEMVRLVESKTWHWQEAFASGNFPSESFSPDGQVLATFEEIGRVYLWEVATGRLLWTI